MFKSASMDTELILYEHEGKTLEAFGAFAPAQKPTVMVFHDWSGRNDFAVDKAKWLCSLGYNGIAMDMYGKGVIGSTIEEKQRFVDPFFKDRAFLLRRMESGFAAVQRHSKVNPSMVGAMGFCFGGLCVLDLARSGAELQGVVSIHGKLAPPGYPTHPKGRVLALHGYADPFVLPDELSHFQQEMTDAQIDWQVHAYGKTFHSFTNPSANDPERGLVYSPLAEKRALRATENFFQEIFP